MSHEDPNAKPQQFLGMYRGIVRNSFDPNEQGLVQVEVMPMMKDIATEDLPWSEPKWPLNRVYVPQEGATIWVQFEAGNLYKPIYEFMGMPMKNLEAGDGNHAHKTVDRGDYADMAAKADDAATDMGVTSAPAYPYRDIFVTPGGIVVEVDDTPDNQRVLVWHPAGTGLQIDKTKVTLKHTSGTKVTVEEDGKLLAEGVADVAITAAGNVSVECVDAAIVASGNVDVGCVDAQLTASGNVTADVTGDVTVNSENATVNANTKAVVDAPAIELGAGATGAIVTTAHICAFTGAPHPAGSSVAKAAT